VKGTYVFYFDDLTYLRKFSIRKIGQPLSLKGFVSRSEDCYTHVHSKGLQCGGNALVRFCTLIKYTHAHVPSCFNIF